MPARHYFCLQNINISFEYTDFYAKISLMLDTSAKNKSISTNSFYLLHYLASLVTPVRGLPINLNIIISASNRRPPVDICVFSTDIYFFIEINVLWAENICASTYLHSTYLLSLTYLVCWLFFIFPYRNIPISIHETF